MKLNTIIAVFGAAAVAALTPGIASAQSSFSVSIGSGPSYGYGGYRYGGNSNYDRHYDEHEQLAEQHGDVHDQLYDEHAQAHEQGLDPWEHRQLHRELRYQHAQEHYQVAREHQAQHYYNYGRNYSRYGDRRYYGY